MIRSRNCVLSVALLMAFSTGAHAGLARVGPIDPAHGYPKWYQDHNNLTLEICIPDAAELAAGSCLVDPDFLPNPTQPDTFPSNFSDEHFWYHTAASVPTAAGQGSIEFAMEAAFNGAVVKGGQIAFARTRIRIDIPAPGGDYEITHPYGTTKFTRVAPGRRAINFTDDVGIACAVGDFSCAMNSAIGPFLRPANTPGATALAPVELFPNKFYLADPTREGPVTGSPFNTNVFRIKGPNIGGPGINEVSTTAFTVMGRLQNQPIPIPWTVDRASYSRNLSTATVDVLATATPVVGAPTPKLTFKFENADAGSTTMGQAGEHFFGRVALSDPASIPAKLIVTNEADVPASQMEMALRDHVHITTAHYHPVKKTLRVMAASSDLRTQPELVAEGFGTLVNGVLVVPDLASPPAVIKVRSAAGGMASAQVMVSNEALANDDNVSALAETGMVINVLLNDTNADATTVQIADAPANGTAVVDPNTGSVRYVPNKYYLGTDKFTYTVKGFDGVLSRKANVNITVKLPTRTTATR